MNALYVIKCMLIITQFRVTGAGFLLRRWWSWCCAVDLRKATKQIFNCFSHALFVVNKNKMLFTCIQLTFWQTFKMAERKMGLRKCVLISPARPDTWGYLVLKSWQQKYPWSSQRNRISTQMSFISENTLHNKYKVNTQVWHRDASAVGLNIWAKLGLFAGLVNMTWWALSCLSMQQRWIESLSEFFIRFKWRPLITHVWNNECRSQTARSQTNSDVLNKLVDFY